MPACVTLAHAFCFTVKAVAQHRLRWCCSLLSGSLTVRPGCRSCTSSASGTCVQTEASNPESNPICHPTPIQAALRLKQVTMPLSLLCGMCESDGSSAAYLCLSHQLCCMPLLWWQCICMVSSDAQAHVVDNCCAVSRHDDLTYCTHPCAEPQQHGMGCAERVHPHPHPGSHAHLGVRCAAIQDLAQVMRQRLQSRSVLWHGNAFAPLPSDCDAVIPASVMLIGSQVVEQVAA